MFCILRGTICFESASCSCSSRVDGPHLFSGLSIVASFGRLVDSIANRIDIEHAIVR